MLQNVVSKITDLFCKIRIIVSIEYGKSSNKGRGRLLNFEDFRRGFYWREVFIKFLAEKKFLISFLYKTTLKEVKTICRLFLHRSQ